MSLTEAYSLAHTAQCRLQLAASRPDRNLRFVVGHLMHFESLRLRIVEIEHDMTKRLRTSAIAFEETGHVNHHIQHKPSSLGRRSPPPPTQAYDDDTDSDDEEGDDDIAFDDEADNGLSLERFPSASSQPTRMVAEPELPDLEPDDEDHYSSDEEAEPKTPSQEELHQAVQGESNDLYTTYYEGVRNCVCHGRTDAPKIERMWELPPDRTGVTRAVAQTSDSPKEQQLLSAHQHAQTIVA